MKKIKMFDIITIVNTMFIGWIVISTLQVMLRVGTIQAWNFWQLVVNLMKKIRKGLKQNRWRFL